jgi:hypothetical protein
VVVAVAFGVSLGAPASLALAASAPNPASTLKCSARVSNAAPAQYSDVTVYVSTRSGAHVHTVAHFKTTKNTKSTTANRAGHASIMYSVSDATKGYRVVVAVTTTYKGATGHCSTNFTPSQVKRQRGMQVMVETVIEGPRE